MMYGMKRLQIAIEVELDTDLGRPALEPGTSKAALIRQFVREKIHPLPPQSADPLFHMAGVDDFDPKPVDDTVYR